VHRCDRPGDRMVTDALGENLAPFGGQELGIAKAFNAIRRIENYRGRDDRTKQRTSTDFINARYELRARGKGEFFKFRGALKFLEKTEFGGGFGERLTGFGLSCLFRGGHEKSLPRERKSRVRAVAAKRMLALRQMRNPVPAALEQGTHLASCIDFLQG